MEVWFNTNWILLVPLACTYLSLRAILVSSNLFNVHYWVALCYKPVTRLSNYATQQENIHGKAIGKVMAMSPILITILVFV